MLADTSPVPSMYGIFTYIYHILPWKKNQPLIYPTWILREWNQQQKTCSWLMTIWLRVENLRWGSCTEACEGGVEERKRGARRPGETRRALC